LWEIIACVDGYNRANGMEEMPAMMGEELEHMIERHRLIVR
jgi:hypothetical protein